ncbi:protein serine/threonine phosphatase 2C [Favolaschia claudopus]|uniref:Protein serine/threonine phosphatase 2C n=1 Tax=Favolaschia claudopus TaxID=2862362 RepID=A0AAW0AGL3_9AGAR
MTRNALHSRLAEEASSCTISGIDALSFQPGTLANEDRYHIEEWALPDGKWQILAIFDGHGAGIEAVEFVQTMLPFTIKDRLMAEVQKHQNAVITNSKIAESLIESIRQVDEQIQQGILSLFPSNIQLDDLSDDNIRSAILDPDSAEGNSRIEVLRAITGTTALVALVDPRGGIHVASLGDCDAVLGCESNLGWDATFLSSRHNCSNTVEVTRIQQEHPDEPECVDITRKRVLGLITVTRAIGDMLFKLPAFFASRVAPLSCPPMHPNYDVKGLAARNHTPPYISNTADIVHIPSPAIQSSSMTQRRLLILASDGLSNLLSPIEQLAEIGPRLCEAATSDGAANKAVNVLWDALTDVSGENLYASMVSGEYGSRVDDTTIIVCPL